MARPRALPALVLGAVLMIGAVRLAAAETPASGAGTGATHPSPWGFTSSAEWFGEYPRFNPLMAKAGARFLRAFPEWSTLEPRKGERSPGPRRCPGGRCQGERHRPVRRLLVLRPVGDPARATPGRAR